MLWRALACRLLQVLQVLAGLGNLNNAALAQHGDNPSQHGVFVRHGLVDSSGATPSRRSGGMDARGAMRRSQRRQACLSVTQGFRMASQAAAGRLADAALEKSGLGGAINDDAFQPVGSVPASSWGGGRREENARRGVLDEHKQQPGREPYDLGPLAGRAVEDAHAHDMMP